MILGSIPTFFVTGALVDEHFWKPFLKQNDFPVEETQNLSSILSENSEICSPRDQAFDNKFVYIIYIYPTRGPPPGFTRAINLSVKGAKP